MSDPRDPIADAASSRASDAAGVGGPVMLDATRLVSLRWTQRRPTGIDRVCEAYLEHFASRARAVVQHRGVIRVLEEEPSRRLFDLLGERAARFRPRLASLLASALTGAPDRPPQPGIPYINVGDTDFDLAAHRAWTGRHRVRPFYFIHDLIPSLHPQFSRPHAVRRHRNRVRSALTTGAGIVLGSQAVYRDLAAFARAESLPLPPVALAPLGVCGLGRVAPVAPAIARPFFLAVGTVEPRKNHRLLLTVWRMLAERLGPGTPRLVLAGQTGPMTGQILAPLGADPVLRRHVELRTACSDGELAGLMRHARAVLMPSLAEGFGLPVVEALQAGTPVIASDLPVFREVGQGLPLLIDPNDATAWCDAIASAVRYGQSVPDDRCAGAFVPPRWSDHFAVVGRFLAPADPRRESLTERVLAA